MSINSRIKNIREQFCNDSNIELARILNVSRQYANNLVSEGKSVGDKVIDNILLKFPSINPIWLKLGEGEMLKTKSEVVEIPLHTKIETRPRIPLNAAAGSLSVALSGVKSNDCEELPFIQAFSNYNYTILVKGDSMEPEFHSGDELACLQLTNGKANFIQWGRYHVLDTAQGVLVKRIYDKGDYILCKSDNSDLYEDFKIRKEEIYNLGLVIGMLRRY